MAMDIGKHLAELKQMTVRELREKHQKVFGEPRARASPITEQVERILRLLGGEQILVRRVGWRLGGIFRGSVLNVL